jgi:hypothetical protein
MSEAKCVGDRCVECGKDTSFGSGRFVNRIPADRDLDKDSPFKHLIKEGYSRVDGYLCADCTSEECDRCGELVALDEQIIESDFENGFRFNCWMVCYDCLTQEEKNFLYKEVI